MYTNKEQRGKKEEEKKKRGLYRNFKCTNFYVALKTYRVLHVALLERCPDLLISVFIKGVQVVPAGMGSLASYWSTVVRPMWDLWVGQGYLTVPTNSTGSWGITDNLLRRSCRPMDMMSTPSISMVPAAGSTSLNRATPKDDFPTDANRRLE